MKKVIARVTLKSILSSFIQVVAAHQNRFCEVVTSQTDNNKKEGHTNHPKFSRVTACHNTCAFIPGQLRSSLMPVVPKLWYAHHLWHANALKVVREQTLILFSFTKILKAVLY